MERLEKAIAIADQRIRMRRDVSARASVTLGAFVAFPLASYFIYNSFAAHGVM
jgi:hypothetical protein